MFYLLSNVFGIFPSIGIVKTKVFQYFIMLFVVILSFTNTDKITLSVLPFQFSNFLLRSLTQWHPVWATRISIDASSERCVFTGDKKMSHDMSFAADYTSIVVYI